MSRTWPARDAGGRLPAIVRRWIIFTLVGGIGVVVRLATLTWLWTMGLHYLLAGTLAIEASIIHNFIWHERWTWRDRSGGGVPATLERLMRFNLTVGLVSIGQNLVFMRLLVGGLGIHYLPADLISISLCALVNFLISERLVFRDRDHAPARAVHGKMARPRAEVSKMTSLRFPALILIGIATVSTVRLHAQDLPEARVRAWDAYVRLTEDRIRRELDSSGAAFLALDHRDDDRQRWERLLNGDIWIDRFETRDAGGDSIGVPGGRIHHWVGAVLIPNVTLRQVLDDVQNPDDAAVQPEDVLETRVLDRGPDWMEVYLKLVRKKIVTATYNTEHRVEYARHGTRRASSRTVATRIAEVADAGRPSEREKPAGEDRGFLWRMNSYWRYEETEAGVLVECESITLSRSIPLLARPFVAPIVNGVAEESLDRTLSSLRERIVSSSAAK